MISYMRRWYRICFARGGDPTRMAMVRIIKLLDLIGQPSLACAAPSVEGV